MSTYLVIISYHFSSSGNTEIITNSVVILFICDLDELLYAILMVCSRRCVESMSQEEHGKSETDLLSLETICGVNAKLEGKVANLEEEIRKMKLLLEHSSLDFVLLDRSHNPPQHNQHTHEHRGDAELEGKVPSLNNEEIRILRKFLLDHSPIVAVPRDSLV